MINPRSPGDMESTAWVPGFYITEEGYATDSNILVESFKSAVEATTAFIRDMMTPKESV